MLRKPLLSLLLLLGAPVLFGACSDSDDEEKPLPSALIIDREVLDYGELEVGQSSPEQLFTIRNASPSAVESVSVSIDGLGFTITANTCERYLDAGMECEVRVRFKPALAGSYGARLKVEGAPAVDQADLRGQAVAWVEVASMPAGVRIVAGDNEWSCDQPCRMPVRKGELTLRTSPEGYPSWEGSCAAAANNGCLLRMDGPKRVVLRSLSPLFQWEVRRDREPASVVAAPNGDILVLDSLELTRLNGAGQVLWTRSMQNASELVLDAGGNLYVMDYTGRVVRHDAQGNVLWTYTPSGMFPSGYRLAVSASGYVYVLTALGSYETERPLKLVALTADGSERWSVLFNDGHINYPSGLGVDAQGQVYVSGSAFNRGATAGETLFVRNYFRKFNPEGTRLWETDGAWFDFAISPTGETSSFSVSVSAPGGFTHYWLGTDGKVLWNVSSSNGPGVVSTQAFSSAGALLIGGYEQLPGSSTPGRGWFSLMNLQTRTPGPVTYVDSPSSTGTRVSSLGFTPAGHVLVGGGHGSNPGSGGGFVRMYDARVLSGN